MVFEYLDNFYFHFNYKYFPRKGNPSLYKRKADMQIGHVLTLATCLQAFKTNLMTITGKPIQAFRFLYHDNFFNQRNDDKKFYKIPILLLNLVF